MSDPPYLPLVEQLASFEPPVFVFDVLVARAMLERHLGQLGSLGFTDFDVFFESRPGVPLVLGAAHGGLNVEVGLFDELELGTASFVLPIEGRLVRITLPADTLRYPVASVDGVPIRTISPLALYQLREAFILTGAFGPARDKDRVAQARLREELLAGIPEADLNPRIERAPTDERR